ncbi:hypothetical protein DAPPUDRAFT_300364 [Daphnia pulex]|uniref:Secreted protein n=1 Tax=Daphnia pulex TaxID=6669 RepID=E9G5J2_DAPPU|nr:hypothetical protein DAPPUDRAFT_300364 [Daphnia pulex]|eukprot:EFX85622.1 hypothetical protein DAPPUDRAFT_300364 [Daphnia pulex]
MKLIVAVLSLVYLISAHPVELPNLSGNRLQIVEQESLNHLVELVLALKTTDHIPKNIGELTHAQLTNCVSTEQRHLVKLCILKASCIHKTGDPAVCGLMNPAAAPVNDEANISPEKIHEIAELLFPMTMGCVVEGISQMGMDGFTNITFLKNGIIERSTMTGPQKMSASVALESCMESDLTIPQINGVDELSKIPEKANKNNVAIALKAMICSGKSMMQNGCYESTVPFN